MSGNSSTDVQQCHLNFVHINFDIQCVKDVVEYLASSKLLTLTWLMF